MPAVQMDTSTAGYLNLTNVVKLALGFFMLFTGFMAGQNLMPQVLKNIGFQSLGFTSVAVIYTAFLIFGLIAPAVLKRVQCSPKVVLTSASLCYVQFVLVGMLPASCETCEYEFMVAAILFSSAVIGASAPFLWVMQGTVMTFNSPQPLVNTYATIFQTIFNLSSLSSALIAAPLVTSPKLFFLVFSGISLVGSLILTSIQPAQLHPSIPRQALAVSESLFSNCTALPIFLRADWRAHSVGVYGIVNGVVYNGVVACVLPMLAKTTEQAAWMLLCVGAGRFTGSFAFGYASNRFGRYRCLVFAVVSQSLALLAFALLEVRLIGLKEVLRFSGCLLLGVGNGFMLPNLNACISAAVHDKAAISFATMQVFMSASTVPAFLILPMLSSLQAIAASEIVVIAGSGFLLSRPGFFETLELQKEAGLPAASAVADELSAVVVEASPESNKPLGLSVSKVQEQATHQQCCNWRWVLGWP